MADERIQLSIVNTQLPPGIVLPPGWEFEWLPSQPPKAELAVRTIIDEIAGDPCDDALDGTPAAALEAWRFLASGYDVDMDEVLEQRLFVPVRSYADGIPFAGLCSRHLLPFNGLAAIAYNGPTGLTADQFHTLVFACSHRLTTPARAADDMVDAIGAHLQDVDAIGVQLDVAHCLGCQEKGAPAVECVTSSMGNPEAVHLLLTAIEGED